MAKKRTEKPQHEMTKRQMASWQKRQKRQRLIYLIGAVIVIGVVALLGTGWFISDILPMQKTVITVNDRDYKMSYYVDALEYYNEIGYGDTLAYRLYTIEESIKLNNLVTAAAAEMDITADDKEVKENLKDRGLTVNQASKDIVRAELVGDRLYDEYFEAQVPFSTGQRQVMAMLLESRSVAEGVRTRLAGGEDFGTIAAELSLEETTQEAAGDLGWQPAGILTGELGTSVVEDYAFSAGAGDLSEPLYDEEIYKNMGYWLIEVLDREEDLSAADVQVMLLTSLEEAEEVAGLLDEGGDFATLAGEYSRDISRDEGGAIEALEPGEIGGVVDDLIFNEATELDLLYGPITDDTATTVSGYWLVKVVAIEADRELEEGDRDTLKTQALNEWVMALQEDPDNVIESFLDDELRYWAYYRVAE